MERESISPYSDVGPIEQLKALNNSTVYRPLRTFRPGSSLHVYLAKKKSDLITLTVSTYRISTILLALREIIHEEQLYDPGNRHIILLKGELENIFGAPYITVSQMKSKLDAILYEKHGFECPSSGDLAFRELSAMNFWFSMIGSEDLRLEPLGAFDINKSYQVSPAFMKVLKTVSPEPIMGTAIPYRTICSLTTRYIQDKNNNFFDPRNIKVAKITGSPLQAVFGIEHLASSQTASFIRKQLKIVEPKTVKRLARSVKKLP